MSPATLAVIAKAPAPGRSKTRLCPPCTPGQAAWLAEAALRDTLAALDACGGRRAIVLDGARGPWLPPAFEVIGQRGNGLGERLAAAVEDLGPPVVIVGMDTPQLTPPLLEHARATLARPEVDAVLGPTWDGGYWTIGLSSAPNGVFDGVPMSTERTFDAQLARLRKLGLRCALLPRLRDVDTWQDARAVADGAPASGFALAMRDVEPCVSAA